MKREVNPILNVWTVFIICENQQDGHISKGNFYFFLSKEDACKWIEWVIGEKTRRYKSARATKDRDTYYLVVPKIKRAWKYEPVMLFDYDIKRQR